MIQVRDEYVRQQLGLDLLVHINEEGVRAGMNPFDYSSRVYTSCGHSP